MACLRVMAAWKRGVVGILGMLLRNCCIDYSDILFRLLL
jgi:hypothetical protein